MVLNNIYTSKGNDFDGHAVNLLDEVELDEKMKPPASVWEVDNASEMIRTKMGKVVISKEPSVTLMRLLGNQLDTTIFVMI